MSKKRVPDKKPDKPTRPEKDIPIREDRHWDRFEKGRDGKTPKKGDEGTSDIGPKKKD